VDIYIERRKFRRFKYEAIILHDLLTHQNIFAGKIVNFSKGGLYFESDQTIHPGEEIFLKLTKPADARGDDSLPQLPFVVKILWQKNLQASSLIKGWIVRRNPEGFAVKFDRRSGQDLRARSDRRIVSGRRTGTDHRAEVRHERRGKHEN
jgi:hypothetical protein